MAGDKVHELEVLQEYLNNLSVKVTKFYLFNLSNLILLSVNDILKSYALIVKDKKADVVMEFLDLVITLIKLLNRINGYLKPIFKSHINKRSQVYPNLLASNGTFIGTGLKAYLKKIF